MVFSFLASKYSTAFSVLLQRSASVSAKIKDERDEDATTPKKKTKQNQ